MTGAILLAHCGSVVPFFCLDRLREAPAWAAAGVIFVVVLAVAVIRKKVLKRSDRR